MRRVIQRGACLLLLLLAGCATAPVAPPATNLSLADFWVRPVGPRGLEPTETLLRLDGQRVRVRGFVVAEEEPYPGVFLLAPVQVTLAERADGPADDLPPATLFVHLPERHRSESVAPGRAPVEVAGTLELGAREEAGGRISHVRLLLDDHQLEGNNE